MVHFEHSRRIKKVKVLTKENRLLDLCIIFQTLRLYLSGSIH